MEKITSFRDLFAWQEAQKLLVMIYRITKEFPKEELYGLSSQIRRASVSVTSNIAEGFARTSTKDKLKFYGYARASLAEIQSQLLAAKEVDHINSDLFEKVFSQSETVYKLLNGLIRKLNTP